MRETGVQHESFVLNNNSRSILAFIARARPQIYGFPVINRQLL